MRLPGADSGSPRLGLTLVIGVAHLFSVGCAAPHLFRANRSHRQEQAGSAHIAVLAIAPWDEYKAAVQPAFKLSPDDALAQAMPNTLAIEEKLLSALGAGLKLAPPTTAITETRTTHAKTGAEALTTHDRTETHATGDASRVASGAPLQGAAVSLPPAASALATPIGVDSMLRYWAATALYQEVQILNRYIRDAAVGTDYLPYVVRLQVTLMPLRRDQPYDAYTNVSFFLGDWQSDVATSEKPALVLEESKNAVRILPLLVTDNIEAAIHSRSVNQVRRLALALSAIAGGVGAAGDLQKLDESLRSAIGRDLNSTFTVGRLTDNTLRCRFGATHQAASHFAMVPQTHNVTLLLLVPNEVAGNEPKEGKQKQVRLTARTRFVDVDTGVELPGQSQDDAYRNLAQILNERYRLQLDPARDRPALDLIFRSVASNRLDLFKAALETVSPGTSSSADATWTEVAALRLRSPYSTATLQVPELRKPVVLDAFKTQTPVLQDDTRTSTTTVVRGGVALDAGLLSATLTLHRKEGAIVLPASAVKVSESGREATLTFPSLAAYKLTEQDHLPDGTTARLMLGAVGGTGAVTPLLPDNQCLYLPQARAPKAAFTMTSRARFITQSGGRGKVQLVFSDMGEKAAARLTIEGADAEIVGEPASIVRVVDAGWRVSGNGTLAVSLSNLSALTQVVMTATDEPNRGAAAQVVTMTTAADARGSLPSGERP
jgi:hypothetical protein